MDEEQINQMYARLPDGSRGREADNPDKFHRFFFKEDGQNLRPYMALCEYEAGGMTWHLLCDAFPIQEVLGSDEVKRAWDIRLSNTRNMYLKLREIYTRKGDVYLLSSTIADDLDCLDNILMVSSKLYVTKFQLPELSK